MVAIQIRDVPESTRDALVEAARRQGMSLQAYLFDVIRREADVVTRGRLLHEWADSPLLSGDQPIDSVAVIRRVRKEREQELTRRALGE
jgi:antitoxin FitA